MPVTVSEKKLAEAVDAGYNRFEPDREFAASSLEAFAGRWYHKKKKDAETEAAAAINLIGQGVSVLLPNLAGADIRVSLQPKTTAQEWDAKKTELALNVLMEEINLPEAFEEMVASGILGGHGLVRIGIMAGQDVLSVGDGRYLDPGQVYVRNVDFDDWGLDPDCKKRDEARIEFDRFRIPLEVAMECPAFDKKRLAKVPTLDDLYGDRDDKKVENLSAPDEDRFELEKTIEIWHVAIYSASKTQIVMMGAGKVGSKGNVIGNEAAFLCDPYEFEGPERGPYEMLTLGPPVRGNPLPTCPVHFWRDMHEATRRVANRTLRQLLRTKRVGTYTRGAARDAMNIEETPDGDWVAVDDNKNVEIRDMGGVSEELYKGLEWCMNEFNNASGNIQLMGGSSEISKTATGASLLQGNAQVRLQYMQRKSRECLNKIVRQMAWWMANDPVIKKPLVMRIPGGQNVQVYYDAASRQNGQDLYRFKIEPYFAPPTDPAVRAANIIQFCNAIPAFVPLIQMGIPPQKILELFGRELGVESLLNLVPDPLMQMQNQALYGAGAAQGGPVGMGMSPAGGGGGPPQMQRSAGAGAGGGRQIDQVRSAMSAGVPR